ncbi:hypothetical protein [Thermococcus sp.]
MVSIEYSVKWSFQGYSSKYSDFGGADIIQIKQDNSDVIKDVGVSIGVTIVLGEILELPRTAKIIWDFVGPIILIK